MAIFGTSVTNDVELLINGSSYSAWKTASITNSLESICGEFNVTILDKWRQTQSEWAIKTQDEVTVKIGSDVVMQGYVDAIDVTFGVDSRTITIRGRDKAADLVDCSLITDKSQYKNKTLTELAKEFCSPFDIGVTAEADVGEPFKKWDVQQGETVFENLERAAKLRGVMFISDNRGNLKIVQAGSGRAGDAIVQGENLKSGSCSYDDANRFSEYTCKGQSAGSDETNGKNAAHNKDQATDAGVRRYRPLLVVSEGSSDKKTVKNRAQWEATIRAAKAFSLSCEVVGWRQSSGELWQVNQRVQVKAQFAGVNRDLLINNVTFNKNLTGGTTTNLDLVRPDAYKPESEVKSGTDPSQIGIGW